MRISKNSDLRENHINGSVKSIRTVEYALERIPGEIMKKESTYLLGKKEIRLFNKSGNQLKLMSYDSGENIYSITSEYDSKGNKTKEMTGFCNDRYIEKSSFKYNENLIIKDDLTNGWKLIYRLDGNGNIKDEWSYDDEGYLDSKFNYEYDKNGLLSKTYDWDSIDEFLVYNKIIYVNDSKGNVIRELHYDTKNQLSRRKKFTYEYDENQNWVNKIVELYA